MSQAKPHSQTLPRHHIVFHFKIDLQKDPQRLDTADYTITNQLKEIKSPQKLNSLHLWIFSLLPQLILVSNNQI